jgi:hypothetical protein
VRKFVIAEDENRNGGKRKRSAKICPGQYEIYFEELQNNEAFRINKFNPNNWMKHGTHLPSSNSTLRAGP